MLARLIQRLKTDRNLLIAVIALTCAFQTGALWQARAVTRVEIVSEKSGVLMAQRREASAQFLAQQKGEKKPCSTCEKKRQEAMAARAIVPVPQSQVELPASFDQSLNQSIPAVTDSQVSKLLALPVAKSRDFLPSPPITPQASTANPVNSEQSEAATIDGQK